MAAQQRRGAQAFAWIVVIVFVISIIVAGALGMIYLICWAQTKAGWQADDALLSIRQWCNQRAATLILAAAVVVALVLYEAINGLYRRRQYGEPFVFFVDSRR